jgi:hypothetical protein
LDAQLKEEDCGFVLTGREAKELIFHSPDPIIALDTFLVLNSLKVGV